MELAFTLLGVSIGFIAVCVLDSLLWELRHRRAERLAREWKAGADKEGG